MNSTRLGTVRAYWLGAVVCLGGFLFGYDSGMSVQYQPPMQILRRIVLTVART